MGDLLGALSTFEVAVGNYLVAGAPTLAAIIKVRERVLAVQLALQTAGPAAAIGFGTGVFLAFDGVARALITAGQDFVKGLLTLNLGNIVDALIAGTQLVIKALGAAGQDVVNGIVFAQDTVATALATPAAMVARAPRASAATTVSAVPSLGGGKTTTITVKTSTATSGGVAAAPTAKPGQQLAGAVKTAIAPLNGVVKTFADAGKKPQTAKK